MGGHPGIRTLSKIRKSGVTRQGEDHEDADQPAVLARTCRVRQRSDGQPWSGFARDLCPTFGGRNHEGMPSGMSSRIYQGQGVQVSLIPVIDTDLQPPIISGNRDFDECQEF